MSVPLHNQIQPGTLVSIVLKQDQRTGRQVQGSVAQVLTRGNHPRGVKVRLSDGRVGRVQQLVNYPQSPAPAPKKYYRTMADHNPWADAQDNQSSSQQRQQGFPQQRFYGEQQPQHPPQQQQQQGHGSAQNYYNEPSHSQQQQTDFNAWSGQQGNLPLPARHPARNAAPAHGLSRSDTDNLLASQPDRAEQMEHMQAYEATALESEDDKHRAQLEKEFPNVDGSLIAALYSDTKDLSATREMLQELDRQ